MPANHGVAATPDHPSFPSPRASQAVPRRSRRRVEALDLLSVDDLYTVAPGVEKVEKRPGQSLDACFD
jgi:hypothetical protein